MKKAFCIASNGRKVRHGVSLEEIHWLDRLCVPERSKVIILFGKTYVIDGYDPATKTCYEYNGSRFHGSHLLYKKNRDVVDPWLKKSPNQLYNETKRRYQLLVDMGFKVFFAWDYQVKKGNLGRFYNGIADTLY